MTAHIAKFSSFSIFFISTSLLFWPFMLVLTGLLVLAPVMVYWPADLLLNLEMLITGVNLPNQDWSLIFLVPAFILGLPALLCHYGGSLMESQVEVYSLLTQSMTTPYGLIGWIITTSILGAFFFWASWCVQKVLGLNQKISGNYLAVMTVIIGLSVFFM